MGCQISACGTDIQLNWSRASYGVMGLASRWFDRARDCDSDGWYQYQIHETSIANLNAEAPHDLESFREYCAVHLGEKTAAELDDSELARMREFIAAADRAGDGVSCSH